MIYPTSNPNTWFFFNFWLCETHTPYSAQNIGYLTAINLKTIQTEGRTALDEGGKMLTAVQPGGKNLTSIAHTPWKRPPFIKKDLKQKFRMETLIFCGKNTPSKITTLISNLWDFQGISGKCKKKPRMKTEIFNGHR